MFDRLRHDAAESPAARILYLDARELVRKKAGKTDRNFRSYIGQMHDKSDYGPRGI